MIYIESDYHSKHTYNDPTYSDCDTTDNVNVTCSTCTNMTHFKNYTRITNTNANENIIEKPTNPKKQFNKNIILKTISFCSKYIPIRRIRPRFRETSNINPLQIKNKEI
ncbi:MAG: hypothetical protein PHD05_00380 [Sphaerochaetaceae bacterium]|nr:hypothetical protein [Sphaerochaetaceae bacterium]